jgi:ABC-2 type transport system permease protein
MTMLTKFEWQQAVARISPQTLYGEVTAMLLDPARSEVPAPALRRPANLVPAPPCETTWRNGENML